MRVRSLLPGVALAFMCAGAPLVAAPPTEVAAPSVDTKEPATTFDVRGNTMRADGTKRIVVFDGDVRATFGEMVMRCATLTVHYTQAEGKSEVDAQGVSKAIAEGDVVLSQGDSVAKSKRAVMDIENSMVTLTGKPILYQGERVLSGETITYNIKTKQFMARGAKSDGVRLQFSATPPDDGSADDAVERENP